MKRITGRILFFSLGMLLASCSNVYHLTIEVQEPASITVPLDVSRVLVVDNTVAQPDSFGLERDYNGKEVKGYYPALDSVSQACIDALSGKIQEAKFFSGVSAYKEKLRSDNQWLSRGQLTKELQKEFFESPDLNLDAIISVDQLLFNIVQKSKTISKEYYTPDTPVFTEVHVDGKLSCSIYIKGREKALTAFTILDSISYKSSFHADSLELVVFKNLPEVLAEELAYRLGEQAALYFTPSWKMVDRIIYTSGTDSRMKEAVSYFRSNKWDKAEDSWMAIYNDKRNPHDKARLAMNIAVANEMQDNLDIAYSWAEKSKEIYMQTDTEKNAEGIKTVNEYIIALGKRVQYSRLLDYQWGVESQNSNE